MAQILLSKGYLNFFGAVQISSGLSSSGVFRLKKTFQLIPPYVLRHSPHAYL